MNLKAISKNVGLALLVSALFMFICLGVSFADGKDAAFSALLVSGTITFIFGIFPFIFVRKSQQISLQDGFAIIVLAWLLSFVFGMLPYVLWGGNLSLTDCWFESVSGFTTTGATILNDVEALPRSLLLWRSSTHFIGGLGVVVFLLFIIPSASPFRRRLTKIEISSLSKEGYNMQSRKLIKVISLVYLSICILSIILLTIVGMPLFDAINHAFSLCASGGFSTRNGSIAAYGSVAVNVVALVMMVLATTNFILLFTCFTHRSLKPFRNNHMAMVYILSLFLMSAGVILSLRFQSGSTNWKDAILDGLCTTISYATTTGLTFSDNTHWPFLACIILVYASIQCGMAGSTSSGIKIDRMTVVFKSISRQIHNIIHPGSTARIKFGDSWMPDEQVLPIILYIVLYFIILIVSTALLLICGVGGTEALSGSVACLGNVGPGMGEISAAGTYSAMPAAAKLIFSLDMFLGRIEIYPLLIAVYLIFHRER